MDDTRELQTALLAARFDEARDAAARVNWEAVIAQAQEEDVDAMRACSMGAEILDYHGESAAVTERLRPLAGMADKRLHALVDDGKGAPRSDDDRRVLKQWVWIALQVAMADYRANRLDDAMLRCRLCESALHRIQNLASYPCFGTAARIHYSIGLIYRERFDHASAKKSFLRCIEYAWRSMLHKVDVPSATFKQTHWADVTLARALGIGLGFVYYADAQPDLALPVLLSAKQLLSRLGETLLNTYVDLVYFDARRSAYGGDTLIVDDAIEGLERCHAVFVARHHALYRARSAFSLALAYSQRARPDETHPLTNAGVQDLQRAEAYATELKTYALETGDARARLYAMLCQSRIERKRDNLAAAVEIATNAIDHGGSFNNQIHTSLLIARADALVRLGKVGAAVDDFREALDLSEGSVRSRAICLLRLTDILASHGQSKLAREHFDDWLQIRAHISNAHIGRLEQMARVALEKASQDFIIRLTDARLDPVDLEHRLHGFLVQWAIRQTKTDAEAAKLLGVSRQTLLNWKNWDTRTRARGLPVDTRRD